MQKIEIEKEIVKNKNGKNIEITRLKAKSDKNLITYKDIENIYNKMKNNNMVSSDAKIIGANRYKAFTLKSSGEKEFIPEDEYYQNKPGSEKLNGFYSIAIIETTSSK